MRQPCNIDGSDVIGFPSIYNILHDIPTSVAVRNIEAGFISSIIENTVGAAEILSFNPGRGYLYKRLLQKYFQNKRLRLLAVETDKDFAALLKENFPGDYMDTLVPEAVNFMYSSVFWADNIAKEFDFSKESFNFIELSFSITGFMLKESIKNFLRRLYSLLKPGGYLIIADMDYDIGSYLETRIQSYRCFYKEMSLNICEGFVTCIKNKKRQLPFLDMNNIISDNDFLINFYRTKFNSFKSEAALSNIPEAEEIVNAELDKIGRGLRFYRPKEEWKEIVSSVFGASSNIILMGAEDIAKKYPDVKDSPFVLIASKS